MNIELATNSHGELLIISDEKFNSDIIRVEYYKDQKLFMLIYKDPDFEGDLMHYEIPNDAVDFVKAAPNMIIIVVPDDNEVKKIRAYKTPLIRIGI